MQIKVLLAEQEEVVNRSQVVRIVATSEKFWERFNGDVSFGAIYSKTPIGREQTAAALIYAKASFFRFSRTHFDGMVIALPALSDPGRVRFNTNLTYYSK